MQASFDTIHITRCAWAEGLKKILCLGPLFPLLTLQEVLGLPKIGSDNTLGGPINFMLFIQRFQPVLSFQKLSDEQLPVFLSRSLDKLAHILSSHHFRLASLFSFFDLDGNGLISYRELRVGLESLQDVYKEAKFTQTEEVAIMKFFDRDQSGNINVSEFLNGFELACPHLTKSIQFYRRQIQAKQQRRRLTTVLVQTQRSYTQRRSSV